MFHVVKNDFFEGARAMRKLLDTRFADRWDPLDPRRFIWERWYVPRQYSHLRTPAPLAFGKELALAFEERLRDWAGWQLGIGTIAGTPWLSVMVDGDGLALHRDSPNGELGFSFGLGRGRFRGGETLLARPELLDYWRSGSFRDSEASEPLFVEIASAFGRLILFDARVPHAVRMVEGPRHPRDGRIALQGWLRAKGIVSDRPVEQAPFDRALRSLKVDIEGMLSIRFDASKGRLQKGRVVLDLSVGDEASRKSVAASLVRKLASVRVPSEVSRIVVPVRVRKRQLVIAS